MSTHLDRKALKRPDAFLEKAGGLMGVVSENLGAVVAGVAVLFAAGLGLTFYNNHVEHVAEASDAALFEARVVLDEGLKKAEPAVAKTPKSDESTKSAKSAKSDEAPKAPSADWKTATRAGVDAVEKVAHDFDGTRAAFEANLLLGDLYYKHSEFDPAIGYYKKAVDSPRPRASKPVALYSLAYAYESTKNYDGAVDALRQVVASDNAAFKADALLALGRVYALKGDKPKAVEAYGQVSKDYANSPLAKQAEAAASRVR